MSAGPASCAESSENLLYAQLAHLESRFVNACSFGSSTEDVHLIWQVVW